jgi:hypothetical protein
MLFLVVDMNNYDLLLGLEFFMKNGNGCGCGKRCHTSM